MTFAGVRHMPQAINESWNKREKYQLLSNQISIYQTHNPLSTKVFSKLEKHKDQLYNTIKKKKKNNYKI